MPTLTFHSDDYTLLQHYAKRDKTTAASLVKKFIKNYIASQSLVNPAMGFSFEYSDEEMAEIQTPLEFYTLAFNSQVGVQCQEFWKLAGVNSVSDLESFIKKPILEGLIRFSPTPPGRTWVLS